MLVGLAAVQSFGIDASRVMDFAGLRDTLANIDTPVSRDTLVLDDTTSVQDSVAVTDTIAARDTIKVPDSLQFTDPFFFKYYIAVKDSTTRKQVRDSLIQAGDTLELIKLDSLYIKDSTEVAVAKFNAWYNSLSRKERKKYDYEKELPIKIAAALRKMEVQDSIRAVKDSIISATPRILETFALPDSMHYKRIVVWKHDRKFHDINLQKFDTTYNYLLS